MSDVAEDSDIVDAEIDATPASPAKMSTPRRLGLALMVVTAFALSLARHIPTMSDRFTAGLAHRIGASYVGEIQKNYERGGFVALRGRPVTRSVAERSGGRADLRQPSAVSLLDDLRHRPSVRDEVRQRCARCPSFSAH